MVKRYIKENSILTGTIPTPGAYMTFRFDGADICLMEWDELVDEEGKSVKADENGYYVECYGDETGDCAECPESNICFGKAKR